MSGSAKAAITGSGRLLRNAAGASRCMAMELVMNRARLAQAAGYVSWTLSIRSRAAMRSSIGGCVSKRWWNQDL